MQQNEQEFIRILKDRLEGALPKEELDDIISDYSEHFRIGTANGRTGEELWQSLGSPDDIAREIRALHLVKKAEEVRSAGNIFHAVVATLGLGLFNLVFVLAPFIILVMVLLVIFLLGVLLVFGGIAGAACAVLQLAGAAGFSIWLSPVAGAFISTGLISTGLLMVLGDFLLARLCYHAGIWYLRWNISIITGTGSAA